MYLPNKGLKPQIIILNFKLSVHHGSMGHDTLSHVN